MGQKEIKRQKPTFEGQSAEEFIKRWNAITKAIKMRAEMAEQEKVVSYDAITGDYAGELTKGQKKTVTPAKAQFSVLPDDGYDFLSEVVVNGVPIAYADNPAGGQTVTIGA